MTAHGMMTYVYNDDAILMSQTASSMAKRYTETLQPFSQVLQAKAGTAPITEYLYILSRQAPPSGSSRTWYAEDAFGSVRPIVSDVSTTAWDYALRSLRDA